ncbi:hypothetical protein WAI453_007289 [Rhynchosporium graminicola]
MATKHKDNIDPNRQRHPFLESTIAIYVSPPNDNQEVGSAGPDIVPEVINTRDIPDEHRSRIAQIRVIVSLVISISRVA